MEDNIKDIVIKGTELKLALNVSDIGKYVLEDLNFHIIAYTNQKKKFKIEKEDCIFVNDSCYLILIDTSLYDAGNLILDIFLDILDDDFEDGARTEIYRIKTNIKIKL